MIHQKKKRMTILGNITFLPVVVCMIATSMPCRAAIDGSYIVTGTAKLSDTAIIASAEDRQLMPANNKFDIIRATGTANGIYLSKIRSVP